MTTAVLVEHFFRREYARLVAVLMRRAGRRHLAAIEDAAQSALLRALETWTTGGVPDNPSGWLYAVARNALLDGLRTQGTRQRLLERDFVAMVDSDVPPPPEQEESDLLEMLFVCCDDALPAESQLALALKTLCGFSVAEIAARLLISEANVYKRLGRARNVLRRQPKSAILGAPDRTGSRSDGVHRVIYALFAEGYLSARADATIRRELCEEAIRLGLLLAGDVGGPSPQTSALNALMYLHIARLAGRVDEAGGLLLLEEQDRSVWDQAAIGTGLEWLGRSANGETFSRYHAEAGIAAEHCLAPSFAATRWDRIAELYGLLQKTAPSPIHRLNAAIAIAEWLGPEAGLAHLDGLDISDAPALAYMHAAVLSDLHRRCGRSGMAQQCRVDAMEGAPTAAVRTLLARRLQLPA